MHACACALSIVRVVLGIGSRTASTPHARRWSTCVQCMHQRAVVAHVEVAVLTLAESKYQQAHSIVAKVVRRGRLHHPSGFVAVCVRNAQLGQ